MSKDRKKRREGGRGARSDKSEGSPPSDPNNTAIMTEPMDCAPVDVSSTPNDVSNNVASLLSSLREEALGTVPPPPATYSPSK